MDHRAVQERLSDYLEGELSGPERDEVAAHLQSCEECGTELAALKQMLRSLSGLKEIPAPEGFAKKVQQRIHRRSRGRFFKQERLFMRIPFEWISFVIIMLMLVMYILMMEGQQKVKPSPSPSPGTKTIPTVPAPKK